MHVAVTSSATPMATSELVAVMSCSVVSCNVMIGSVLFLAVLF